MLPSVMVSVLPYRPFHVGPTPGAPSAVWQATQPLDWASDLPCAARACGPSAAAFAFAFAVAAPPPAGLAITVANVGCAASHLPKEASSSTTTWLRML